MTRVSKRAVGLAVVATVLNAEVDPGAVRATRRNFPSPSCFPPDHENATLGDGIFTSRDSGLR
jgi:hypothetical protein